MRIDKMKNRPPFTKNEAIKDVQKFTYSAMWNIKQIKRYSLPSFLHSHSLHRKEC